MVGLYLMGYVRHLWHQLIYMRTGKVKWGLQRAVKETCFAFCVLWLDSPVCKTNSLRNTGRNALQGDPQCPTELLLQPFHSYCIPTELSCGISLHTAVHFHKTWLQILKLATPVSHLIETGPTVIARRLKDTNTETGRSQKICILRKSGKQDLSGSGIWHKAEWLGLQSNWQCNKWEHLEAATIPKNSDLTSLACASGSALFCYQCSNSGHCHRHFGNWNPGC